MNARNTLSIFGLAALLATGAPALAAAENEQLPDVRTSQTHLPPGILPDATKLYESDSAIKRDGAGSARALWISWLMRLTNF